MRNAVKLSAFVLLAIGTLGLLISEFIFRLGERCHPNIRCSECCGAGYLRFCALGHET